MSAPKHTAVSYVVRGHWPFPVDMLRYDGSRAASDADAAMIERLSAEHAPDRAAFKDVEISLLSDRQLPFNSAERWESFGWEVPGDVFRILQKKQAAADSRRAAEERVRDAATDLLTALKGIAFAGPRHRCLECGGQPVTGHADNCRVGAAIAKATGETGQ